MNLKVKTNYKSGWYIVILPVLEFLIIFFSIPIYLSNHFAGNGFVIFLGMILTIILAFGIPVATFRFFMALANRGSGEIELEDNLIKWKAGRGRKKEINLSTKNKILIAAGTSPLDNASILISGEKESAYIYINNFSLEKVLKNFPHQYFIDEAAIAPEKGMPGFSLEAKTSGAEEFFSHLLSILWQNRHQNEIFLIYEKFPWGKKPAPASAYIKEINFKNKTAEEEKLIKKLKEEIISKPVPWLAATSDYLLGYIYDSAIKSVFSAEPDRYLIMPLGKISAKESLPTPELGKLLLGQTIITAMGGRGGPYLEHKYYLEISGTNADSKKISKVFEWVGPGDNEYYEGKAFVKFVNKMAG